MAYIVRIGLMACATRSCPWWLDYLKEEFPSKKVDLYHVVSGIAKLFSFFVLFCDLKLLNMCFGHIYNMLFILLVCNFNLLNMCSRHRFKEHKEGSTCFQRKIQEASSRVGTIEKKR